LHEKSCSQTSAGFADTYPERPAARVPTAGSLTLLHTGLLRIGIRLPREQQQVLKEPMARKVVLIKILRRSPKATNKK